ncbi:hypothetical protein GCM10007389_37210 [Pontibacter akesuensis]|nr:hypothetical protein GCM10007389_37210 [Pontibacter akesuensis]
MLDVRLVAFPAVVALAVIGTPAAIPVPLFRDDRSTDQNPFAFTVPVRPVLTPLANMVTTLPGSVEVPVMSLTGPQVVIGLITGVAVVSLTVSKLEGVEIAFAHRVLVLI